MELLDLVREGFSIFLGVSWELIGFVCRLVSQQDSSEGVAREVSCPSVAYVHEKGSMRSGRGLYVLRWSA